MLALAYAAACGDRWEDAAELLGAVSEALFRDTASFLHLALLRDRLVRPHLDAAAFEAATGRGAGRDLTAILDRHGV